MRAKNDPRQELETASETVAYPVSEKAHCSECFYSQWLPETEKGPEKTLKIAQRYAKIDKIYRICLLQIKSGFIAI